MVDALVPAASVSKQHTASSLDVALSAVAEAARLGTEKTKDMVAAVGKAKTLGERSLGHADPGAISTTLILKFMTEYVTE
jgi:dihydroxyacetone kinase-like protein